jgi:hypothetical protein
MVGSASLGFGLVQQRSYQSIVLMLGKIAGEMFTFKLMAATLAKWRTEEVSVSVTARHRHFTWAANLLQHRYFRDNLYAHASPLMVANF